MLSFITEKQSCWDRLKAEKRPIFMYGMGDGALKIMSVFKKKNITLSGIFASDEFVRGHSFQGFRVHSLSEIESYVSDFVVVLAFAAGYQSLVDKIHEIEMKNVEFRYPQRSESAVKNINLRILTGEKIAIVGENGSGKTTLLYLLLGIYRPISGEASVNGKTMELNLDNYRKKTACLIQNFVHFQMTLRENLAPNDFSELSEDPLIDFANNFPDRLNTFLGALDSNGVELSGGQWKRIALYRTLHKKDVDLIVLDEPTANLDPKISENIINRLLKPNYNKTVIVITHDFELAKKFDRIIGMKEGKIICDSPPQAFAWELFEKHNSDKRSLPQIG